ncbi:hypothetical protein AVL59_00720 [Streptomyces griseochromogenes]|uniref:Uncharacterized protein n=1 Tax=Streptomyces griseochromogenes TaxID=68214 RepID=A0A1B1ANX9_9ACTN|nr:hypothetical protein AVL59_00720 [Streptomyces griseochromogenes]
MPSTAISTPSAVSGTITGRENRVPYSTTAAPGPAHSVSAVAASPMLSMPCAITPGRPTAEARESDQWMGLWSPEAAA